ncbi:hypothetical protein T11_6109 [Trichinella zimbabwensis]|uniref:Uncharacterized protein n=1 Tax=Trichinella zimbabwensis TaxID=268475 RepID=A0A0V1I0V3_9BILA|nr:hypothetical protein T11_6109 [Trichinella zimbabwensis]
MHCNQPAKMTSDSQCSDNQSSIVHKRRNSNQPISWNCTPACSQYTVVHNSMDAHTSLSRQLR